MELIQFGVSTPSSCPAHQHNDDNDEENGSEGASANPNVISEKRRQMLQHDLVLSTAITCVTAGTKKADVARHSRVLNHVGLLVNGPPGIHRAALHLVVRLGARAFARSPLLLIVSPAAAGHKAILDISLPGWYREVD